MKAEWLFSALIFPNAGSAWLFTVALIREDRVAIFCTYFPEWKVGLVICLCFKSCRLKKIKNILQQLFLTSVIYITAVFIIYTFEYLKKFVVTAISDYLSDGKALTN